MANIVINKVADDTKYLSLDVKAATSIPFEEVDSLSDEERRKLVDGISIPATAAGFGDNTLNKVYPISFKDELICIILFLIFPGGALWGLPALIALYIMLPYVFYCVAVVLVILAVIPATFWHGALLTDTAIALLKYFSFRGVWPHPFPLKKGKAYILCAPPHGVFPFGNICTMVGMPRFAGFTFRGLAASAVLRTPVFRQLVSWIGGIDASRSVALATLKKDLTIGISPGGIAEIFETNKQHEVVILKNRTGMARLSLLTGAPIVPCYLFGNSTALSLWYDSGGFLQRISRKLRFSLFIFWGRYLLPIPYRIPITGVMGKPIPVTKTDKPTKQQIEELHAELLKQMKVLFDTHKAAYGWADKELIIK